MGGDKPGGVDLYVGGTEHAVLHLLYARFWHKVLFDLRYVSKPEPFQRLVNQGIILGEDNQKMSKSRGNIVNPDDVIEQYGADAFRCGEMVRGPLEQMKPWGMRGVEGIARFLARVWRLMMSENQAGQWGLSPAVQDVDLTKAQRKILHATIKKVTDDIESLSFNTAISQMMIFVNAFTTAQTIPISAMQPFLVLLNPFAPHLSSELWEKLKLPGQITEQPWPGYDERFLVKDVVMPPVSLLTGGLDFSNKFIVLRAAKDGSIAFNTPADAAKAGAVTWNYGNFITLIINFLIVAGAVFFLIRAMNRLKQPKHAEPVTKECPACAMTIPVKASRCPHCTTEFSRQSPV